MLPPFAADDGGEDPQSLGEEEEEVSEGGAGDEGGEAGYIYACNMCGQQYAVKEQCERHLKIHMDPQGRCRLGSGTIFIKYLCLMERENLCTELQQNQRTLQILKIIVGCRSNSVSVT